MIEKYLSEETYEMSKADTNGLKIAIIGSGIGSLALISFSYGEVDFAVITTVAVSIGFPLVSTISKK